MDPHHGDADLDSTYHPDADPDSDFLVDADPDPTFHPDADPDQVLVSKKAQTLEKVLKLAHIPYILPCHLQIDADLVPVRIQLINSDADPVFI